MRQTEEEIKASSIYPMYRVGQTAWTREKTKIHALSFEIHHKDGFNLVNWTHKGINPEMENIPKEFSGCKLILPIYPTEINRTQVNRMDVSQNISYSSELEPEAVINNWGMSTPKWNVRGHTGWGIRRIGTIEIDGYMAYVALFNYFLNYQKENLHRLKFKQDRVYMAMFNWSDSYQDFWYVEASALPSKVRSVSKPLHYQYELNLIGVKPYWQASKVVDVIANTVGNDEARIKLVGESLKELHEKLKTYDDLKEIPLTQKTKIEEIKAGILTIKQGIDDGLKGFKNTLLVVSTTAEQVVTAATELKVYARTALSPIFEVVHTLNDVKCALQTLAQIPVDFYSELDSDMNNLINALKSSSCGTTLRAGGVGSGKYGWERLR